MSARRKYVSGIGFLLAMVLTLSACSAGANEKSSTGDTKDLRIAVALGDAVSIDPARVLADAMQLITPLWGDTLVDVTQDDPTKLRPALAESWEASEDAKSYTLHLRKGVKFSTGATLTAKDVKFSLERFKNVGGSPAFMLGGLQDVTVVDDNTVKIELDAPDSSFIARLAAPNIVILDSSDLAQHGGSAATDAVTSDTSQSYLDSATVGTGPYKLKSWDRNQKMVFERNPDYWGTKGTYDQVTLLDVRTPATQAQLIAKGDVDIAMDIDPDTAKSAASGVKVSSTPSYNLIYLAVNNAAPGVPELGNAKVRQAIQMAVDYDGISKGLADGAKRPAAVVPLGFQGSDDVTPAKYDVEGAKKLMAEAGVNSLTLPVVYANVTWYGVPQKTLWEKLAADLSAIGITVDLKPVEYTEWATQFRANTIPLTSGLWAPDFYDSSGYLDVFGRNDGALAKRVSMNLPEGEDKYDEYLSTTEQEQRTSIATDLVKLMKTDASYIPIVQPNKLILYRDALTGVDYSPNKQITIATIKPA